MTIKESAKNFIIENANRLELVSEEDKKEMRDKRAYFVKKFSAKNLKTLEKAHYFLGKGERIDNLSYELEFRSGLLGKIGGGSVYKFGYEQDFEKIKNLLVKIASSKNSFSQFYTSDGNLTTFSREIVKDSRSIKGVGRAVVGKILSIYYPNIFIALFGRQDDFLSQLYDDYKPETTGVELYARNNYMLYQIKKKYTPDLSGDEFSRLLYKTFEIKKANYLSSIDDDTKFEALEVQHYQALIHRNFEKIFKRKLKYFDIESQNERKGQFDTQEVGVMDFLAVDQNNDLVVIELKRESTDKTLGQILRYMGWVNKNLCRKGQKVKGMIIAESMDNRLKYALTVASSVTFKKMKLNVEIEL